MSRKKRLSVHPREPCVTLQQFSGWEASGCNQTIVMIPSKHWLSWLLNVKSLPDSSHSCACEYVYCSILRVCSGGDCAVHSAEASREEQMPYSIPLCHVPFKTGSLAEPGVSLAVGQPQGPLSASWGHWGQRQMHSGTQLFTFVLEVWTQALSAQ